MTVSGRIRVEGKELTGNSKSRRMLIQSLWVCYYREITRSVLDRTRLIGHLFFNSEIAMKQLLIGDVKYQIVPHSTRDLNDRFMIVTSRIIPPRPFSGSGDVTDKLGLQKKEIRICRRNDKEALKTRYYIENQEQASVLL